MKFILKIKQECFLSHQKRHLWTQRALGYFIIFFSDSSFSQSIRQNFFSYWVSNKNLFLSCWTARCLHVNIKKNLDWSIKENKKLERMMARRPTTTSWTSLTLWPMSRHPTISCWSKKNDTKALKSERLHRNECINQQTEFNVQGRSKQALDVIELVYKIEATICIFTEVDKPLNANKLLHFNICYWKGMNHSGGICITVGKHRKASRIEINILNIVVIDITRLSEPVRIIGIYWSNSQKQDFDNILSFTVEDIILTDNFNATVKEWMEGNNLNYIPATSYSSKRLIFTIDISFSNMTAVSCVILHFGSSNHCALALTCENIFFNMRGSFSHTNWKVFEVILVLFQTFLIEE